MLPTVAASGAALAAAGAAVGTVHRQEVVDLAVVGDLVAAAVEEEEDIVPLQEAAVVGVEVDTVPLQEEAVVAVEVEDTVHLQVVEEVVVVDISNNHVAEEKLGKPTAAAVAL